MQKTNIKEANILIVDDEAANVLVLQRLLENEGYRHLHCTTDPTEVGALHMRHDFDLILLDINMPQLDGFAVMARLKAIEHDSSKFPVILVLTALSDLNTRLRSLSSGARDFLTKPFERMEVISRIHNLLEVRCLQRQLLLQNEELEQKVCERTLQLEEKAEQLQETQMEIIRRLGRAAEYRDNETGLHIIRMSKYSQLLGKAAGMSDAEAELVLSASPMHDVGKIGIPDSILLKPGKLSAEEWNIMKTHVSIGADILSGHHSELMKMSGLIALTHHEKWDGSGYPNGLKGEDIPLVGRIVALADVFDALTSKRSYKKAWNVEDAMTEMDRQSGKHFDPKLVQHFKTILADILLVKEQYAEPSAAH